MEYIIVTAEDLANNNTINKVLHSLPIKSKENALAVLSSICRGFSNVYKGILNHLNGNQRNARGNIQMMKWKVIKRLKNKQKIK